MKTGATLKEIGVNCDGQEKTLLPGKRSFCRGRAIRSETKGVGLNTG